MVKKLLSATVFLLLLLLSFMVTVLLLPSESQPEEKKNVNIKIPEEERTEYDIEVFKKMMTKKRRFIPTRPHHIKFI